MGIFSFLKKNKAPTITKENIKEIDIDKYTLDKCSKYVKHTIDEILKTSIDEAGLTPEELDKKHYRKNHLKIALKKCMYGDIKNKKYVKDYISDLLTKGYEVSENNINYIINFDNSSSLTIREKFDVLLYSYTKQHNEYGFTKLIENYNLDKLKNNEEQLTYSITEEEIENIFREENPKLNFQDKLELLTQRIYCHYKGLGVIDEIRDQSIDGISGGVSGLPEDFISKSEGLEYYLRQTDKEFKSIPRSYESIWIFFKGKSVHLEFLSFESFKELERVCKNIYKFNSPGQLDEAKGYMTNKMADGSRIVVLRPPFAETWCFFVRKFHVPNVSLNFLIRDKNSDIVIKLISYLMKGRQTVAITGDQGVGKTTFLLAMLEHIYNILNLRFVENFFELHARTRYPNKNIVSIQETGTLTQQDGLNIIKKSDGDVTISGEVADDKTCASLIEVSEVASKFTLYTHHAKKFSSLVRALRNSLLKTGVFKNEKIAEEQVISVLDFNIHLSKTLEGKRYIERITECIPVKSEDYPTDFRNKITTEEKMIAFMETALVFFKKLTDVKSYEERNIFEFDLENDSYVIKNTISKERIQYMKKHMTVKDGKEFFSFIESLESAVI